VGGGHGRGSSGATATSRLPNAALRRSAALTALQSNAALPKRGHPIGGRDGGCASETATCDPLGDQAEAVRAAKRRRVALTAAFRQPDWTAGGAAAPPSPERRSPI